MIQRIQTLYLFLASVSLAVMFFLPIYTFQEKQTDGTLMDVKLTIQGRFEKSVDTGEYILAKPSYARSLMTLAIGLGIFVSIFRYANRKQQINICRAMIVLTFVLIITLLNGASKVVNSGTAENIITGYAVLFPSISVVLTALAARAIKKDEELVRSADRIR
jgi:Domain of unknown function (DUF4293)